MGVPKMRNRRTKIIVNILMTNFLILSFIRWDGMGGVIYHIVVGSACALFFSAHIFIYKKWIKATTKSCFADKLSKALKGKYIIDILLLVVWSISIVTGFIAVVPFFRESVSGFVQGRLNGLTARIGLVLIIIHVVQHIPQIKSYFGFKRRVENAG